MWREVRAWLWVILLGVFIIWGAHGFPPFGLEQKRTVNNGVIDDSWECRHPPKGGPICWKKPAQNVPAAP